MKAWTKRLTRPMALIALLVLLAGVALGEAEETVFSYSDGLDDNGHWTDVTALDYVTLFDYSAIPVPAESHEISDEAVQAELDAILEAHATTEAILDRAVADGDTVNIDYVGSVGGVEFEGGSTGGVGTEVTIGVTSYIEGFLDQLVGRNPGETFDLVVTFPDDYGVEELNGQEAVFVTTINHIVHPVTPTLDDAFVAESLSGEYGVDTVEALRQTIRDALQSEAILTYLQAYLTTEATVDSVPEVIVTHQQQTLISYYAQYASYFGMDVESFLVMAEGVDSVEALLESYDEYITNGARYYLVLQAIAEDMNLEVTDADVAAFFEANYGSADYSMYEAEYGMPYLKQMVMCEMVMEKLVAGIVLE